MIEKFLFGRAIALVFAMMLAIGGGASAATITQLAGTGDFVSTSVFSNDFEGVSADTPEFTFDSSTFLFLASSSTSGVTSSGVSVLAETQDNAPLSAQFSLDVFEVGLFFGNDAISFGVFDVTLEAFDATSASLGSVVVATNANDFADQFIGLRSDEAIRSISLSFGVNSLAIVIDDFTIGANASVVPVPAALPLFGTGLAIMGFVGWRRKRKLA